MENWGTTSAFAALSKRPEFNEEIKPKVIPNGKNLELLFEMYIKGDQVTVTTDDLLPYYTEEGNLDYKKLYANSKQ